jgi:GPI mannosyltransferase 3
LLNKLCPVNYLHLQLVHRKKQKTKFMAFQIDSRFVRLVAIRIITALVVNTYFSPDEFWQSLEVAHYQVFHPELFRATLEAQRLTPQLSGYLTWEWIHRIRSSVYPQIFSLLYYALYFFGFDTPWMVRFALF